MDDFSLELLATMPQARRMQAEGATYRNAHVVDSLCCPSRAAIFTGRPPHQTRVLTNTANDSVHPIGGYTAFAAPRQRAEGVQRRAAPERLHTGFIGKYMNGYEMYTNYEGKHIAPAKVPGWDVLEAVLGGGYPEWGFRSTYIDKDGVMQLRRTPKPKRSSPVPVLDRPTRPTSWPTARAGSCAASATRPSRTSSRSRPTGRTRR